MLVNPYFEGTTRPGGWTRNCHDGVEHPEIYSAESWTAWHSPDLDHPEMHVIPNKSPYDKPARIAEGDWAVKLFKSFSKVDAGLYQVVNGLTLGATYVIGYKAHAWCLHDGLPHFGDPYCSVIGCGSLYWDEAAIPPLNDDPVSDATGAALFSVGIGLAPADPYHNVLWGKKAAIYNVYQNVPELIFTAQSDTMVVYLRAELIWQFRNNDVYLDAVYLREVEVPPSPCKGLPRFDYSSTYNVIPANATEQRAIEIFVEGWRRGKENAGGSYDAPGVGDFTNKLARLYDIPKSDRLKYMNFYGEYYPDTKIEFAGEITPSPITLELTYPATHMPPVITQHFHAGHSALDIRASYKHYNGDEIICALDGVVEIAEWAKVFGYQVLTSTIMADGREVDIRYAHLLEDLYVQIGDHVVAGQKLGKAGGTSDPPVPDHLHISVFVIDGDDRKYVDPEPLIDWPAVEPPSTRAAPATLHLQTMSGEWERYIREMKPQCAKVMASDHDCMGIRRANVTTLPIYRYFSNDYGNVMDPNLTPLQGANNWLDRFMDSISVRCDQMEAEFPELLPYPLVRVESINEMTASSDEVNLRRVIEIEKAMCYELQRREPRAGLVVQCAAVGNPEPRHYSWLAELALIAMETDTWFGYHCYYLAGRVLDDWKYLAGRWTEMDKIFVQQGTYVNWYAGEAGVVGGWINPNGTYNLLANDGWKSPTSWNGNWDGYLNDIRTFDRKVAEWNNIHGGRFRGAALFTTGTPHYTGWEEFQIQGPEMISIIEQENWPY